MADGVCHVAVDEGRLVGTANLVVRFDETDPADYRLPGVAAFGQFGVDPDRRGEGIGDALLEAGAAWAEANLDFKFRIPAARATEAQKAISMFNSYTLNDRQLTVNVARPREERGGFRDQRGGHRQRGNSNRRRY